VAFYSFCFNSSFCFSSSIYFLIISSISGNSSSPVAAAGLVKTPFSDSTSFLASFSILGSSAVVSCFCSGT
jgi:hypothetical protein